MQLKFFWLLMSALMLVATAMPATKSSECDEDDEDCREQFMHPNMPVMQSRKVSGEETKSFWLENGKSFVQQKQATADQPQRGVAKNVVFFVGDGMSLTTLAATRVYIGGEEKKLAFEELDHTGLSRTYAIDRIVPDSASTATAMFSGSKAMYGTIGVNGHVQRGDCKATKNPAYYVDSLAKLALDAGKSVGIVTTASITDATPAALYAHSSERDWENDKEVRADCGENSGVVDIAQQLIVGEVGSQLTLAFGGGKSHFVDKSLYANGNRRDGRNLIDEFLSESKDNVYIESRAELKNLKLSENGRVLGLFGDSNLLYHLEADLEYDDQPTLTEMTEKAIELLQTNPNGFVLFVEGALIDKAHHVTLAKLSIDETAELNSAVARTSELTSKDDTLIVVTSDHSHTLSISGYAPRGNNIFDVTSVIADDDLPYMTLSYANGPSYYRFFDKSTNQRVDPDDITGKSAADLFPGTAPMISETHGGEDVAVYASGPWSMLFSGAYEQSTIPHLISYATCLGQGLTACD